MKTSVVMATYNGSDFILEQLDSIINQTVLPDEIVISDDGSTDSTIKLVQSFFKLHEDLPIRFQLVLNDSENHGVLGNFQNAFNYSNGEYVFFCDQDDVWFPRKIERLINVLDSHKEQVVFHNAQVLRENDDGSFHPMDKYLMGNYPFDSEGLCKINGSAQVWPAFYYCIIQGMCVCAKRSYLLSISPFSKGLGHDYWVLFCAAADDTLLAVSDNLAYYRIHSNNACGIPELKKKKSLWERIKTFDRKGEESVLKQYIWYSDTSSYLDGREVLDDKVRLLISFFADRRISALSKGKVSGIIDLLQAYKKGTYEIDGYTVLFHDIAFILMHTKKTRKEYCATFKKFLRAESKKNTNLDL